MLAAKAVAALVFIWIMAAFLGALFEAQELGVAQQLSINEILFYDITSVEGSVGIVELASGPVNFFASLWDKFTFHFVFITGEWELVRWFAFGALTAYFVYGSVLTVISILRGIV